MELTGEGQRRELNFEIESEEAKIEKENGNADGGV